MANILKQIKIGNITYNIEPVTAYLPLSGGTINANNSKAPLILKGGASNWNEGLRIIPTNNWATILLAGTDADENTGTSAKSWSIHNYDGSFYISKNGSDYAPTKLSNTDGTWRVNDNDIIHSGNIGSQNVNYANSAGSVAWGNVTARPITITQRNNDSPISGAYAWGTYVTIRNANNWFEMYAPHMGTSSDRVYMQTGWDNDRQGWKAIAWTSDIPTSLPASDVYAWAKSPTKPSYTKSEIGLGNVDNTADANKNVNYANSAGTANYFNYGRGAILANSSSFTNNFCKDIFGEENNNNYHLVALRTNSQAPSSLLGDYSSGIAWKGSDTYGSLMVRYNTSEIRVSGGNGANSNPKWTVDLVHSGNIGSQNVNYANSAGSVAWGNVTGKPDLTDKTYVDTQLGNVRNSISGLGSALNNKADKGHTHSYLPLSGGSMTGTINLASSSNGIQFNSSSYYVTNMESGSVDVTLGYALGNETSKTVSFHGGSKGSGTWHVVAQADGVLSDNVSIGVTSISNTGFTIWVKNVLAGSSSRTLRLHYIAVKYY